MAIKKKKVIVLGGGNGSAVCLEALKEFIRKFDITGVISMSDSGGSSGRLRKEFGTLPPGDIMRAVLSLSKYDYKSLRQVFYKPRFSGLGKLNTHNLGNLFLVLAAQYGGSFMHGLNALATSVEACGKVFPVTMHTVDLAAELNNGSIVRTEAFIDKPEYNRGWKIKKVWLEPECDVYEEAEKAIRQADYIILSPGSLYTSLISTLLPAGVREAIAQSKAKIYYVAGNAFRLDGETGPEKLSDFVLQLEYYLPRPIDLIIYNRCRITKQRKEFYNNHKWGMIKFDKASLAEKKIICRDIESKEGGICAKKLRKIFFEKMK